MFKHDDQKATRRLVAALTVLVAVSGCEMPSPQELAALEAEQVATVEQGLACLGNMTTYQNGATITCTCSSTDITNGGTVWGTDAYTDDSSPCVAAVHAGRITTAGGSITATVTSSGRGSYTASTRHGITSAAYGSWGRSFYFP